MKNSMVVKPSSGWISSLDLTSYATKQKAALTQGRSQYESSSSELKEQLLPRSCWLQHVYSVQ